MPMTCNEEHTMTDREREIFGGLAQLFGCVAEQYRRLAALDEAPCASTGDDPTIQAGIAQLQQQATAMLKRSRAALAAQVRPDDRLADTLAEIEFLDRQIDRNEGR
jgi:hypothetical protein